MKKKIQPPVAEEADRHFYLELQTHTPGVREGNWPGEGVHARREQGIDPVTQGGGSRSTGINPKDREPIDPKSPKLSPP